MTEDIIKLGIALVVIVCSYFSSRWILKAVYKSAGLSKNDVFSYRASVSRSKHPGRLLNVWIMQHSSNPAKTRKYLDLYTLATASGALYASFTFIAIIVDGEALLKLHILVGLALLLFYAVLFVLGKRYKGVNGDTGSLKSDARDYIDFAKKHTERKDTDAHNKSIFVGVIQLVVFVGLMIFCVVSINRCSNAPMEPTSYSIVWDASIKQGCQPYETLEKYRTQWKDDEEEKKLLKAFVAENKDLAIEYFEFCEDTYAKNITSQSIEKFREKDGYDKDKESLKSRGNYNIYVYSDGETVVKIYRVDKTLLFVRYPKEKKPVSDEFLKDIGYINKK